MQIGKRSVFELKYKLGNVQARNKDFLLFGLSYRIDHITYLALDLNMQDESTE